MTALTVVLGPKSRLGQELIRRRVALGQPVVAVARSTDDLAALDGSGCEVIHKAADLPADAQSLTIAVCALGPMHPTEPGDTTDQAADSAAVDRDLALLDDLLTAGPPGHVVLVSTVLALAPAPDRRYYGGWKCVVEQQLSDRVHARGAQLSVLYPGRLTEDTDLKRPWHRLHTRYTRLAVAIEKAADGSPRSRVVGLDARLWLLARGLSVALSAVTGSGGAVSTPSHHRAATTTNEGFAR